MDSPTRAPTSKYSLLSPASPAWAGPGPGPAAAVTRRAAAARRRWAWRVEAEGARRLNAACCITAAIARFG